MLMRRVLFALIAGALPSHAAAASMICTVAPANETLDTLQETKAEVPVIKMTMAGGIQAILAANTKGEFMLLGLHPDGRACIIAVGDGMKVAGPVDRFLAEQEQ